jgi:hypothetical protein
MTKRLVAFAVIFFMLASITGCASVQRKFTRKKKAETVKIPKIHKIKEYERKPTPELYKKHYVYWESFQSEMLRTLGQNHKRDRAYIEHILSNLHDMQNMLKPQKASELELHIKRLAVVKDMLQKEDLTKFNRSYITMTLERESRYIKRGFIYSKIKDDMLSSYEDDAAAQPEPQNTEGSPVAQDGPAR